MVATRAIMKGTERQIQEAIEIGQANKRTVELVQNWCGHVEIERVGGVGFVEAQTGLPIGMRGLNCPHAKDRGMAAMDLEAVALDFYDRNCAGCTNRQPVRLPNLSEVVGRRDQRRARAQAHAAQERDAEQAATARRAADRQQHARGGDAARRTILQRIDELDSDPTPDRAALLLENVRAIPDKFDLATQDALYALIDAGGLRARTALEALSSVASGSDRLANAALRMLEMREAPRLAAVALGDGLRTASEDQIKAALPAIFELAAPNAGFGRTADAIPEPLVGAWAAAPSAVREFMGVLFHSEGKHSRILACRSASILVVHDAGLAEEFARLALGSIGRPDDSYGPEGAASNAVSKLLSVCLTNRFDEVDALLQVEWKTAAEEQRSAIVDAYVKILRRRDEEEPPPSSLVEEKCFKRVVEVISARKVDESFSAAIEFVRYAARRHLDYVEQNAEVLIGAAALLLDDMKERYSPLLDPRPTMLKAMEADTRRTQMRSAVDAIMDLVGHAGAASPHGAGALIVKTLENLHYDQEALRAALVKCLGQMGQSRDGLSLVVPAVYSGMMAREQVVRAAAASAYAEIAEEAGEDLPRLMHETFLLLLQDPYIIVHAAAVHAVRRARLPKDLAESARIIVWLLVDAHSKDGEHESLLADCIEAFLRLTRGSLAAAGRSKINTIIVRMTAYLSARLLTTNARALAGVPEYGDVVVRVLSARETTDSDRDTLLDCLGRLSSDDVVRLGADLARIAAKVHPGPGGALERILDVAARVEAWTVCEQIAKAPLAALADVPRDQALQCISSARLIAVLFEVALAGGDRTRVTGLAKDWRTAQTAIEANHPDIGERWPLLRAFSIRVEALDAVNAIANGSASAEQIQRAVDALAGIADSFGEATAGRAYSSYGRVVAAFGHLVRWAAAVRSAEADADRFLRAGKQAARDIRATLDAASTASWSNGIASTLDRIEAVVDLEGIAPAATQLASIPLPLPFTERLSRQRRSPPRDENVAATPCVVFVSFTVDGIPLADPHFITPDELHDLDVTVRVSRWPAGARLILDAITVEPAPTIGELPRFMLDRPQTEPPHEIKHGGRMLIRVAQAIAARPLEFVYRAYFSPEQARLEVVVEGERRIRVRSHDPARSPVTGYRQVDLKLIEIRDLLRTFVGLQDRDVDAFLLLLAALGQMAGEALQDKIFPGRIPETEFQQKVRQRLRGDARIGSELQEHAQVAGGIMDLSFREITIELKVEPDTLVVPDGVEGYSQQAAQYTAGNDKRLGLLCVLDCSDKTSAPGSVVNDIVLRQVPPPGQPHGVPLLLGVVIVRGNLLRPSDLSR